MNRKGKAILVAVILVIILGFIVVYKRSSAPSVTGIGVLVRTQDQRLEVAGVVGDTPAARAGMRVGMWIQQIDGTNTADLSIQECAGRMRGRVGSIVHLRVVDPATQETNILTFTRVKLAVPAGGGKGP